MQTSQIPGKIWGLCSLSLSPLLSHYPNVIEFSQVLTSLLPQLSEESQALVTPCGGTLQLSELSCGGSVRHEDYHQLSWRLTSSPASVAPE